MKRLGCVAIVLGVVVVAVGGFVAVLFWSLGNQDDQSALTLEIPITVVGEPDEVGQRGSRSWTFDYAYEVAGQWYGAEGDVGTREWTPGRPLSACVDPSDPTRHVLAVSYECGQEFTRSGTIDEATPRSAP